MTNKYPSLYAALEPETTPSGQRGSTVRCTATRKALGFVWWSCEVVDGQSLVTWHYRVGAETGETNTERNAVEALRAVANGESAHPLPASWLPFEGAAEAAQSAKRTAPARPRVVEAEVAAAPQRVAAPRIIWNDEAPVLDVTAALRDAFGRTR